MTIRTTLVNRLRRATLRAQLTMLYAGLLVVVVAVVLVAAAFLFRTATAPQGVETHHGTSFEIGAAVVIVLAVLVGLWFAWQLAGLYLRPLRTLNATARDISATNLHRRLGLQGPDDELTQLGDTLDDLFGRLESSFESQRRFVANASHELRTPLAGQRTLLQVALADPDATTESLRAACEEALALGERQERLTDGLLTLASSERGIERRESLDLAEITERMLVSRHEEAARRGIEIRASLDVAPTTGDPVLVESMIANLLDNAIQHNIPNGSVDLTTGRLTAASQLSVRNSGPIVPTPEVERLFQPFQQLGHDRTGPGHGHGLGLTIVHAIATAHSAKVTAHSRSAGGLDIKVSFPYGASARSATSFPPASGARSTSRSTAWTSKASAFDNDEASPWPAAPGLMTPARDARCRPRVRVSYRVHDQQQPLAALSTATRRHCDSVEDRQTPRQTVAKERPRSSRAPRDAAAARRADRVRSDDLGSIEHVRCIPADSA